MSGNEQKTKQNGEHHHPQPPRQTEARVHIHHANHGLPLHGGDEHLARLLVPPLLIARPPACRTARRRTVRRPPVVHSQGETGRDAQRRHVIRLPRTLVPADPACSAVLGKGGRAHLSRAMPRPALTFRHREPVLLQHPRPDGMAHGGRVGPDVSTGVQRLQIRAQQHHIVTPETPGQSRALHHTRRASDDPHLTRRAMDGGEMPVHRLAPDQILIEDQRARHRVLAHVRRLAGARRAGHQDLHASMMNGSTLPRRAVQ